MICMFVPNVMQCLVNQSRRYRNRHGATRADDLHRVPLDRDLRSAEMEGERCWRRWARRRTASRRRVVRHKDDIEVGRERHLGVQGHTLRKGSSRPVGCMSYHPRRVHATLSLVLNAQVRKFPCTKIRPPVGELRFTRTEPLTAGWEGIRRATEFGNRCPQESAAGAARLFPSG